MLIYAVVELGKCSPLKFEKKKSYFFPDTRFPVLIFNAFIVDTSREKLKPTSH